MLLVLCNAGLQKRLVGGRERVVIVNPSIAVDLGKLVADLLAVFAGQLRQLIEDFCRAHVLNLPLQTALSSPEIDR